MTWNHQTNVVVGKLNNVIVQKCNLKNFLTRKQLMIFYHSKVASIIKYGICCWGQAISISRLLNLQKRIMRTIKGAIPQQFCIDIFSEFNICLKVMYKYTDILNIEVCVLKQKKNSNDI